MAGENAVYSTEKGTNKTFSGETDRSTLNKSFEQLVKDGKVVDVRGRKQIIQKAVGGLIQLFLGKDFAHLASGTMGFEVSSSGCIVAGPTDFTASPHEIRIAGFWILNEELLTTVPSTLFSPVQTLLYSDPPTAKKAGKLAKLLAGF